MLAAHVETSPAESPHAEAVWRIHVASHLSHHNAATTLRHPLTPSSTNAKMRPLRDIRVHIRASLVCAPDARFPSRRELPRHGYNQLGRFAFT